MVPRLSVCAEARQLFYGLQDARISGRPGRIRELGTFLKEKGINDVLVVTGCGMVRRGQVQPMLNGFEANGIRYTLQTYSATAPTTDDVEAYSNKTYTPGWKISLPRKLLS